MNKENHQYTKLTYTHTDVVICLSYMLTMSVSVRLPSDQAAFARTLGERSSRAVRMALAVSATNITSCGRQKKVSKVKPMQNTFLNEGGFTDSKTLYI